MLPWRHPDPAALTRFLEGEASGEEAQAIHDHLARCSRCRADAAFFREVSRVAQELTHPSPPDGLLEEVLARRKAGERVILPTAPLPPEDERSKPLMAFVTLALLLLVGAAALFLTSGEAAAGASTLRVSPEVPRAGQLLQLEFRAASPLAREEALRVRGWYRTAEEPPPRGKLGTDLRAQLSREETGRFSGELWLPPSAVYAVFLVEDLDRTRVETNGQRLWEVLVHDENGRPFFGALRQKFRVLVQRNWEAALQTARAMTTLYPDRAEGWYYRFLYEQRITDPSATDSLANVYSEVFRHLEQVIASRSEPEPNEMAALAHLARLLEEAEPFRRWSQRLQGEAPDHPLAVQLRVVAAVRERGHQPRSLLSALEEEWNGSGGGHELVASHAFRAALAADDSAAILKWANRYERVRPDEAGWIGTRLTDQPSLRSEGMARLREELANLGSDRSSSEIFPGRTGSKQTQRLLAALGEALAAEGKVRAALDTLSLAASGQWNPELFRRIAKIHLDVGDTASARRLLAYVAADPLTRSSFSDSVRSAFEITLRQWERTLAAAREEMKRRVLDGSEVRRLDSNVSVLDQDGAERKLSDLLAGDVSLVVYWSRFSYPSLQDLPRLQNLWEERPSHGVRVISVIAEEPNPDLRSFLSAHRYTFSVFHDGSGEVAESLSSWATPQYVVIDDRGRMRFAHASFDRAYRQLLALREERGSTRG